MEPGDQCSKTGRLDGRVALVTGGANGIGKAVVQRLICEGAKVCILDRTFPSADHDQHEDIFEFQGDVTSYNDNLACVSETISRFGRIDIFVGNAGIYDGALKLIDLPEDRLSQAFDEVFSVNVKGYLLGAKATLPYPAKVVRSDFPVCVHHPPKGHTFNLHFLVTSAD